MTPHPDRPFLAGALEIARRLHDSHLADRWGPTWEGDDLLGDRPDTASVVRQAIGPDLYGGRAGIGWFLVHAGVEGGERRFTRLGLAALAAALAVTNGGGDASLYSGRLGVLLAARQAAKRAGAGAGSPDDAAAAAGLAKEVDGAVPDWCEQLSHTPVPDTSDLLGGAAGQLWGLHLLQEGRRCVLPAAAELARRLHASARRRGAGLGADWPERTASVGLCGMAHGNSGIALGLLAAAAMLRQPRHARLADAACALERARFDASEANWPDLREGQRSFMQAWCHGGIGIGVHRLVWHRATKRLDALAEAGVGLAGARAVVMAAGHAVGRGETLDITPCHGLAGAVDLFVLAHSFSGQAEHTLAAARSAQLLLQALHSGKWRPGLAGTTWVPGLMVGLAGAGACLLRVHRDSAIGSPLLAGADRADIDRLRWPQPVPKTQPSGSTQRTPRSAPTAAM